MLCESGTTINLSFAASQAAVLPSNLVAQLLTEPGGPNLGAEFAVQVEGELDIKEEVEVGVKVRELWVAPKRLEGDGTWSHANWLPSCS